jgi:hypothetical protein
MESKIKILAKLLQDKHITVEEFEVLIQTEKEYIYTGCSCNRFTQPYYPWNDRIIYGDNTGNISLNTDFFTNGKITQNKTQE